MFTFITAVRHPSTAASYVRIESLLRRSLRSICNQSSQNFSVIVVCNQVPANPHPDKRIRYLLTPEFPVDTNDLLYRTRTDKGFKIALGLAAARELQPTHVMIFDADDFVHRHIVAYSDQHSSSPGWHVDRGFVYDKRTHLVSPLVRFSEICGTSHIIAYHLVEPNGVTPTSTREQVLNALGEEYVQLVLGAHPFIVDFFAARSHIFSPLPFPGAVYQRGTGENDRQWFVAPGFPRPPSVRFCTDFGIEISGSDKLRAFGSWPRSAISHLRRTMTNSREPQDVAVLDAYRTQVLRIASKE